MLDDVQSTLGTFGTNDVVTIKGKYKLVDKSEAKLLLTITQTKGDGHSSVAPEQITTIKDENGHFKLSINIQHNGYLHLSLRSASGEDKSYGSLYFGTEEQMNKIANWDLSKW